MGTFLLFFSSASALFYFTFYFFDAAGERRAGRAHTHTGAMLRLARIVTRMTVLARAWGGGTRGMSAAAAASTGRGPTLRMDADKNIIIQAVPKPTASVVLLHGLGDSGHGWADGTAFILDKVPYVRFVLPTAPVQPVTLNMGMRMNSWYDIEGLDERSNEKCKGIDESKEIVEGLIAREVKDMGSASRVVLAGFSQGGALSLYTGLQQAEPLAGIVCMSGYLPRPSSVSVTSPQTPVRFFHGENDPMVDLSLAQRSFEMVKNAGVADIDIRTYNGLEHSASPEELYDVAKFIESVMPDVENSADQDGPSLKASL